jgi:predicted SAM-dependent methyltransferase
MTHLNTLFAHQKPTPNGLLTRWRLYAGRYGALHAAARFLGTKAPGIWSMVGPAVSAGYRRKWAAGSGLRLLNLGGGGNLIDGALTVDLDPRADSYVNVTKPLPFASASIDLILLEEVIEHIDKAKGAALLRECRRVLKAGGTIRIATPDLDWLGAGVADGSVACDLVNDTFYGHGHAYIYSRAALRDALTAAGFSGCTWSNYRDPGTVLGFLDSHADRFAHDPRLSQYVEAS